MMRKLLIVFGLLCLAGSRWEPHELSPFNWQEGKTIYQRNFVVGEAMPKEIGFVCDERFTVPAGETKWMTPEEAEKENHLAREKGEIK
jgi:hypothetical protein